MVGNANKELAQGSVEEFEENFLKSGHTDPELFIASLRHEQKAVARSSEHYRQIGQALSILEAAVWKVGIISLFPTARVRARRQLFTPPIESFLRQELTGVPTSTLEFYVEDLDNLTDESSSLENLSVQSINFLERSGYFILLSPFVYLLSGLFLQRHLSPMSAWLAAVLPFVIFLGIISVIASDTYRRASFSIVLGKEILRRLGGDTPGASNLRVCPT